MIAVDRRTKACDKRAMEGVIGRCQHNLKANSSPRKWYGYGTKGSNLFFISLLFSHVRAEKQGPASIQGERSSRDSSSVCNCFAGGDVELCAVRFAASSLAHALCSTRFRRSVEKARARTPLHIYLYISYPAMRCENYIGLALLDWIYY